LWNETAVEFGLKAMSEKARHSGLLSLKHPFLFNKNLQSRKSSLTIPVQSRKVNIEINYYYRPTTLWCSMLTDEWGWRFCKCSVTQSYRVLNPQHVVNLLVQHFGNMYTPFVLSLSKDMNSASTSSARTEVRHEPCVHISEMLY
jgi:hypothetical protein